MFIIYFTKEWHLPPFYERMTSSSKSDCLLQNKSSRLYFIISLSRQRGKAQVLVTPPFLVKKLGAVMAALADTVLAPDSQFALSLCLSYKSESPNGQDWHCNIFRHSKDKIWVEINFVSQILGYYLKPSLVSSSAYVGFSWSSKYYSKFVSWLL